MQFTGLLITAGRRAAQPGHIGTGRLGGGVARQYLQYLDGIFEAGYQFVDADQHNMHRRYGGYQSGIAFVGDQSQTAILNHREVGTADTQIGMEKFLTQGLAGPLDQVGDIFRFMFSCQLAEEFSHLIPKHVNGRHDHVARALTGQLHDPFAKVGFHHPACQCLPGHD